MRAPEISQREFVEAYAERSKITPDRIGATFFEHAGWRFQSRRCRCGEGDVCEGWSMEFRNMTPAPQPERDKSREDQSQ